MNGSGSSDRPPALLDRYVVAAFAVQVLSYAALAGLAAHGDVPVLVEYTRRLPAPLSVILGTAAVPALLITFVLGAALQAVGIAPTGVGFVSDVDLPFLVVAYLVAVGAVEWNRRWRRRIEA